MRPLAAVSVDVFRRPSIKGLPPKSPPAVTGLDGTSSLDDGAEEEAGPPRIAEMEDCAQRGCLRIADVTVTHSVTTRATGSTATVIGVEVLEDIVGREGRGSSTVEEVVKVSM